MDRLKSFLDNLSETLSKDIVKELLTIYTSQMNEGLPRLHEFLRDSKYQDASELAHKLKSSSNNVGALTVGQLFQKVEKNPQEFLTMSHIDQIRKEYADYNSNLGSWIGNS